MESKFTDFVLNTWINPEKYNGLSKVSAILLNGLLCIVKLLLCILTLLFLTPHLGARTLHNRDNLSRLGKITYFLLAAISLVFDLPLLCLLFAFVVAAWSTLTTWTLHGFIAALVCGFVAYGLFRLLCMLVCAVFCKAEVTVDNEGDAVCDETYETQEAVMNNDEKMVAAIQEVVDVFGPGEKEFSTQELKKLISEKYQMNEGSVIPSDYCYNRVNDGINPAKKPMLLEYLERGRYRCWGLHYRLNRPVYHKGKIVGKCENGERKLFEK